MRIMRLYYKVVKETAMTASLSIKDSKTLRKLEINEVVEVLQGPTKEDSVDVMRIQAKVLKDGTEGWITIMGNQGTVFLKEGGGLLKVVRETTLTDSFEFEDVNDASQNLRDAMRKVKEGELLEVYEWPRKDEKSGFMRMKARVRGDSAVGWVTTIGSQGIVFAEVM